MRKAIDPVEHRKLITTLLQIEQFLTKDHGKPEELSVAKNLTAELEDAFNHYEQHLRTLERQITEYKEIYLKARTKFVGCKIKELKRDLGAAGFKEFQEAYGWQL
ncbi:hypothetical protein LLH06_20650 [Mucilaginibacter daejeonensis]|uniref:hypothetical protein n=1 Tax=Mucilaginibacter daejeonensis TaxID=398049 RepID=UPI001D1758A0|nr:hypothetical protein [Mucilaginibacter daejeonensis]UEG53349.1 hypothetical protein LLH06_20650 [Mucilaginibacter daejeonensis]